MSVLKLLAAMVLGLAMASGAAAKKQPDGPTKVTAAVMEKNADGTWNFKATVKSEDTGPTFYANKVEIVAPDGKVLHTIPIDKPHVGGKSFDVFASNVKLPDDLPHVTVHARMYPSGASGAFRTLKFPKKKK